MADDITLPAATGTFIAATDEVTSRHFQKVKLAFGADGTATDLSAADPLPVTVGNFPSSQAVTGTFWQATQPVSGTVGVSGSVAVTGTFWQATQPVSAASLPLPTGAATETTLATIAGAVKAEDSAHVSGHSGIPMLAIRQAADVPSSDADGDYTLFKMDEEGRLKVASKPASYAATTGNITANAQTIFVNCERFSNLMLHCSGTFAGANITFEGSLNSTNGTDGNWFGVQAIRSNANTIETTTGVLGAAPAYAWELSVNALKYFRIRATAFTSGTQAWTFVPGTYATEPIPGAQISGTQPVSGTVTATVASTTVTASTPATPTALNFNSAATTNATVVKGSAGTLYGITATNTNAATRYLKLYNKATAPTVGTDVPVITIAIPATGSVALPIGPMGHRFATGIGLATTTGAADSDTAAVAANEVKAIISFI